MNRIDEFLTEAGTFFLATADGVQPKLRPLGSHFVMDGRLIFGVGDFKDVYRQMLANPQVEIAACRKDGHWLRYTGRAVFETEPKFEQEALSRNPGLRKIYNEETGHHMAMFHLEDASAVIIPIMGEGEKLL